jgi:UDP-N-acetylenolpyruvoylglucosamine reductase
MTDYQEIKNILGPLRVYENELLSKHTYFKIGGPAKLFFEAKSVEDLKLALSCAHNLSIPFVILGGGANVLVSDNGFDGLVIKNRADGIKFVGVKGTIGKTGRGIKSALVWAASGALMNQLARFTIDQGLGGLEFLLSVPGTVGGGLKINAHFNIEKGEFIGSRLVTATLFDPRSANTKKVDHIYFHMIIPKFNRPQKLYLRLFSEWMPKINKNFGKRLWIMSSVETTSNQLVLLALVVFLEIFPSLMLPVLTHRI